MLELDQAVAEADPAVRGRCAGGLEEVEQGAGVAESGAVVPVKGLTDLFGVELDEVLADELADEESPAMRAVATT